ncbi:MAG: TIGR04255 family protein [Bacteroidetes bacterium]|nr:TIGR04255 family protein [Bacteroidota bacterium]
MNQSVKNSPNFINPPINEVIFGVVIEPHTNIRIHHIGLLWEKFKKKYPNVEHAKPIMSGDNSLLVDLKTGYPLPRTWFVNKSGDQLVQYQIDRFYYNWRHKNKSYPRYDTISNNYFNVYKIMNEFYNENLLVDIKPIEYELTYINHIKISSSDETYNDIKNILNDYPWKENSRFLHPPNRAGWKLEFNDSAMSGKLVINIKQGISLPDREPLLIIELKVTGQNSNMKDWFEKAHHWIVNGFVDITNEDLQKVWGKQ